MQIGFIGLGNMGGTIATRLSVSGFAVIGCDIDPATLAAFDPPGSRREESALETARQSDILCVCVRTDDQLQALVAQGELFAALGPGNLFILNSTVAPDLARRLEADAREYGVGFIDVGVAGGVAAAKDGRLSLFVGGDAASVARARPLLDTIGTVAHLGAAGRGLEGKLLNNLAAIANFGMAAAILEIGEEMAFDRETLRQALMLGSARSFAFEVVPTMLGWEQLHEPAYYERVRAILEKDVSHAAALAAPGHPAMDALVASSEAMLVRLASAAETRTAPA